MTSAERLQWRRHATLAVGLMCLMCLARPAAACQVPVFRYALERWTPSPLDVVVFHRGGLTADQQRLADSMKAASVEGGGSANFSLRVVDVADGVADFDKPLWERVGQAPLPQVALRYAQPLAKLAAVWTGPLDEQSIRNIVNSPLRRQVAERILQGDSIVFVMVEGGDRARDEKLAMALSASLASVGPELKLPEDAEQAAMSTGPKLRIGLSMVRLPASDPAEQVFAAMLRHVDGEQQPAAEPVVVPIFGRGRALGVIREAEVNEKTIKLAASFLCDECSCQVKEECPGTDMLVAADWEKPFAGGRLSDALPALPGLEQFAPVATQPAVAVQPMTVAAPQGPNRAGTLWRSVGWTAAGLGALGAGMTLLLIVRGRKGQA